MVQQAHANLETLITWDFSVAEQHNQARYGTWHGLFYKQYMPGGTVISALHPPKLIPKALYDHAKKIAEA